MDALISENNLTSLIADFMQTKVKNLHSKEILLMEKEFQQTYDQLKNELEQVYHKEVLLNKEGMDLQEKKLEQKDEKIKELQQIL